MKNQTLYYLNVIKQQQLEKLQNFTTNLETENQNNFLTLLREEKLSEISKTIENIEKCYQWVEQQEALQSFERAEPLNLFDSFIYFNQKVSIVPGYDNLTQEHTYWTIKSEPINNQVLLSDYHQKILETHQGIRYKSINIEYAYRTLNDFTNWDTIKLSEDQLNFIEPFINHATVILQKENNTETESIKKLKELREIFKHEFKKHFSDYHNDIYRVILRLLDGYEPEVYISLANRFFENLKIMTYNQASNYTYRS